ncbi:MAG TPA: hypothetical protein VD996_07640, partial [Chitinophagaceae bacterium]|nr:hypothetical protein [Chitinophagaceae bacterium]
MKKIMLTFFTVTLLTTVGVAQSATRSADVKKQYELRLEQQKKELGATDEQVRKIVDINKHYHKELQAVNGD